MWDKERCCQMLGIPVTLGYLKSEGARGSTRIMTRNIVIDVDSKDDDRVWIHEIAHALLHFKKAEAVKEVNPILYALDEIQADTVAYLVGRVLGVENTEYKKYIGMYIAQLPVAMRGDFINSQKNILIKIARQILTAGGYYGK